MAISTISVALSPSFFLYGSNNGGVNIAGVNTLFEETVSSFWSNLDLYGEFYSPNQFSLMHLFWKLEGDRSLSNKKYHTLIAENLKKY